ncbi:MAG: hypothetical protein KKH41_02315 [Candidatus Thermoplasmatota archaeon]|nr:hypothetical protein [Euryarchaeota archaeon]MBU4031776.1 hypothetical protein [Candidatus Thermoplasmatota archaeon]MBU4070586.1 hypothetical protein [Candidatus Thermoplasmatota archaeon]MBU4143770.1 hypothetical protein [Candidatus Thermoplasmatota archaeon]MBU4591396.1 hypothetical protein [Candidatus Thermoplasmatota archaeon]
MNKITWIIIAVVAAVLLVAALGLSMNDDGAKDPEYVLSANINGSDYTYAEMMDEFGTKTVDGKEGVSLSAMVNDTALANPETWTYVIKADDGYAMAVNWTVMQNGIVTLVEETDEDTGNETAYLMTVFPDMPSGYKVKNFATVIKAQLTPVVLNGLEYYLDYMPKRVEEKTVAYNDTYSATGWSLSDMVNYTGLANPASHNYTIYGDDGYNKTVTWDAMMDGVLIDDTVKTVFSEDSGFGKTKYMIKYVVTIVVE